MLLLKCDSPNFEIKYSSLILPDTLWWRKHPLSSPSQALHLGWPAASPLVPSGAAPYTTPLCSIIAPSLLEHSSEVFRHPILWALSPLLIWTGGSTPLLCLEGPKHSLLVLFLLFGLPLLSLLHRLFFPSPNVPLPQDSILSPSSSLPLSLLFQRNSCLTLTPLMPKCLLPSQPPGCLYSRPGVPNSRI